MKVYSQTGRAQEDKITLLDARSPAGDIESASPKTVFQDKGYNF